MLGDGRTAQPLTASHAGGANEEQTIGQTPKGGSPASGSRCGSCGGPSNGEELCPACQQAFSAMLRRAAPAPAAAAGAAADVAAPAPPSTAPASQPAATRVDQDLWAQLMGTPVPPPMDSFDLPPAHVPAPVTVLPPPPLPPPPVAPGHTGPSDAAIRAAQIAAAQAAAIKLEPIKLEPPKPGSASVHPTAGVAAKVHTPADRPVREAPLPRTARPAATSTPAPLAALLPSTSDRIAASVALLCVIGLGAGGAWYYFRDNAAPMTVIADVVEPEHADGAPAAAPAASPEPEPMQTPAVRRPPANGAPQAPAPGTAAAPVNSPARVKAAPIGRFFQPSEVNEAPRVVRRIEPRVPAALRGRKLDEVVVVRALVSQEGQPSRLSLLRRSKAGAALDDAVLAAVNQWIFTPALKEGEPVSSWFNFAVPVSRPE